jgi:hypothetical protein
VKDLNPLPRLNKLRTAQHLTHSSPYIQEKTRRATGFGCDRGRSSTGRTRADKGEVAAAVVVEGGAAEAEEGAGGGEEDVAAEGAGGAGTRGTIGKGAKG